MTSLTLQAKILGLSVVGVGLLGMTIANTLQIANPTLDAIKIGKIFLSTSGTETTSGRSNITLDGSNGSLELKGDLNMPGYGTRCTSATGCILTTDADGKVQFATIDITQQNNTSDTTTNNQPSFFTRRGGATQQVDTGASEIVFYDRTIIGSNASSDVSLRIGLSGAINSASQGNGKTVDVAGPIMSRTALSLESPIITNQSENYLFSPNRTSAVIQKSTSSDTIEAMKLQVGHTTDDGVSYDRSDFIIESLSNSIKARLGINTPTYPSKELDINGQTLSRGDLIVGSGSNPTLFANTSTKKVGINTTPSRATFDVNGSSKFNGSLSILGTPANIANITNGMTSITLGEITSNETGNLRTLADVGCKLLTVDSNGNLVLEQIPDHICRGTRPTTTPPVCSNRSCLYGNTLTGDTNNDGIPNCTWRQPQLVASEIGCQHQVGQSSCALNTVACQCDLGDSNECFWNVEANFSENRSDYVGSSTVSSCHDRMVVGNTVSYNIYRNEFYPRQERGNAVCSDNTCTTGPSTGRVQTDECLPNNRIFNPGDPRIHPQYINKCLAKRNSTCTTYNANSLLPNGYTSVDSCYEGLLGDPSYQAVMLKSVAQSCTVCPTGQTRDSEQKTCRCDNSGLLPLEKVTFDDGGDLIYTASVCETPRRVSSSTACNGSTYTKSYSCKVNNNTVADSYCPQPKPSNQTVNCSPILPLKMYQCQGINGSNTVWTEITQGIGQQCYENTYDYELIYHFGLHIPPYGVDSVYYKEGSYVCHTQTPSIPCFGGHGWINLFNSQSTDSYNGLAACTCDNSGRKSGCTCTALKD